ncbi:hypothetical protein AA0229_1860 [Gluconobacter cerinus NRIC 0229]|uniref:Uncharacterized protein n=1 Tax=Gluconobacter cerinus TaxID=38307 RepID=A0AAV5NC48_9PROT|nr:hypothetical protein AA0229_1860 [Gluconobacter cerinus NRIC 0229]GLQ61539.1 hypothetical protein GCM10007867_03840 [Gluconobacter cerinus]
MNTEVYAVYLTAATSAYPAGYIINNIVCENTMTPTVSSGQAAVADPDRKYPIGSTYTASAS